MPGTPRYPASYEAYATRNFREKGQSGSAASGTIAAAVAGGASLWTLRYPETAVLPSASLYAGKRLHVNEITVTATVLTDLTAAQLAGRALVLVRGAPTSGTAANPSGGAAYVMVRHRSDLVANDETLGIGRIATTGALTTTGITFETAFLKRMPMSGAGLAGTIYSATWEFDDPIFLLPGQLLAIQPAANFDAAGTWEFAVDVDAAEVP